MTRSRSNSARALGVGKASEDGVYRVPNEHEQWEIGELSDEEILKSSSKDKRQDDDDDDDEEDRSKSNLEPRPHGVGERGTLLFDEEEEEAEEARELTREQVDQSQNGPSLAPPPPDYESVNGGSSGSRRRADSFGEFETANETSKSKP